MQYFFKKFSKKSFTKTLDKIQKIWYSNAAGCIIFLGDNPNKCSSPKSYNAAWYVAVYTWHFWVFALQFALHFFDTKKCKVLYIPEIVSWPAPTTRSREWSRVGESRVGEWFTKIFFHLTLSLHTDPRKPFIFKGLRASTPTKDPNTLYTVKRKWGRKPSPATSRLPYPTLSGTYFTLTLHFFPLQNL